MKTKISKWGNSVALRIPKSFAQQVNLQEGTPVDLKIEKDQLVISPQKQKPDLKSLLSEVNEDNLHEEIDFGEPEGKEVW